MANELQNEADVKTRSNLAYIWSIALIAMVGYTLFEYGHILAVLTLLVGFITGKTETILNVFFGASMASKKTDVVNTGDSPTTNVTTEQK